MEPEKIIEVETLSYYGKKRYCISPLIARKRKPEEKIPDYGDENSTENF